MPFVASYLSTRAVPAVLYVRAARHVPIARGLARGYGTGSCLAAAAWVASLPVPPGAARYALWVVAMLIELCIPFAARRTVSATPRDVSHLSERYGLFTIIVLGEAVLGVVTGLLHVRFAAAVAVTGVACFGVAAGLWWVYFNTADLSGLRTRISTVELFSRSHLPITMGLAATGPGAAAVIAAAGEGRPVPWAAGVALAGGVGVYLLAVAAVRTVLRNGLDRVGVARLAAGALALVLAAEAPRTPPPALAVALAAGLTALVAFEVVCLTRRRRAGVAEEAPAAGGG